MHRHIHTCKEIYKYQNLGMLDRSKIISSHFPCKQSVGWFLSEAVATNHLYYSPFKVLSHSLNSLFSESCSFLAYNPSVHLLLTSELCFSHLKYIVYDLLDLGFHYYFYRNSVHLNQTITYLLYVCSLSVHSLS